MSKTQTVKTGTSKVNTGTNTKKKKSPLILMTVVLFVIAASLALIFFLNIGNVRSIIVAIFTPEALEEAVSEQDQREAQIRDEIIRLNAKEDELDARENQLDLQVSNLNIRLSELEIRIQENDALKELLSPQVEDILKIAGMYKNMESEQAAMILSRMDNLEKVILILRNIGDEKSGEILGLIEPERAAALTVRMMGEIQN